jgi:uroporphyrinogen decarboxylase
MEEEKNVDNFRNLTSLEKVIKGTSCEKTPIWLMRQAGRYLEEYRKVRSTTGSFLEFCYSPAKAAEVTIQPIRRFNFDAAIIFSDILVIPDALGTNVSFHEGEGPRLSKIDVNWLGDLQYNQNKLAPVYEAI